jgi:RimJ/RimL family protein N-acetyltransferase
MQQLADQVRHAIGAADLAAYAHLLDPDVHWGPPGDQSFSCQNRDQVLSWYQRGRDAGVRAEVTETIVSGDRILVGLRVAGRGDGGEPDRWQVLTVRDGLVVDIAGYDDRAVAAASAGLGQPGMRREPARWSLPARPLADELVELRPPRPEDAVTLHEYAARPGGLDGRWVPLNEGADLASCEALIRDWQAGWDNLPSFQGPALVITRPAESRLVGLVGFARRGETTVELDYGVAPDHRRHGYATHAARLVASWLLADDLASQVELVVDSGNAASQRVAAQAGFTRAGTLTSQVPAIGQRHEDLRFVMPPSSGRSSG